jgi:hypothetical protein
MNVDRMRITASCFSVQSVSRPTANARKLKKRISAEALPCVAVIVAH